MNTNDLYDERTVSLWFKVDDAQNNGTLTIYEEDGSTQGLNIYVENDQLWFKTWSQKGNERSGHYLSTNAIASDTWHHAVIVLDTSQTEPFTAYLDGLSIDPQQGEQAKNVGVGVGGLNSVADDLAADNAYSVKDIQVYERSLFQAEIALLYQPNKDPVATEDMSLTVENNQIILFPDFLLDNDLDPDRDTLNIEAVGNASQR